MRPVIWVYQCLDADGNTHEITRHGLEASDEVTPTACDAEFQYRNETAVQVSRDPFSGWCREFVLPDGTPVSVMREGPPDITYRLW